MARFICSVSPDIPWHVTAFHPDYKMTAPPNTLTAQLARVAEIGAEEGLRFVYAGNAPGQVGELWNTLVPQVPPTLDCPPGLCGARIQPHRLRRVPQMPDTHPGPLAR